MAMEESKVTKMKTFVIQEKFTGYADITIEAETEEEAIQIYKDGKFIVCPHCNQGNFVFHFSWSALGCQHCNRMVDKYDWKLL